MRKEFYLYIAGGLFFFLFWGIYFFPAQWLLSQHMTNPPAELHANPNKASSRVSFQSNLAVGLTQIEGVWWQGRGRLSTLSSGRRPVALPGWFTWRIFWVWRDGGLQAVLRLRHPQIQPEMELNFRVWPLLKLAFSPQSFLQQCAKNSDCRFPMQYQPARFYFPMPWLQGLGVAFDLLQPGGVMSLNFQSIQGSEVLNVQWHWEQAALGLAQGLTIGAYNGQLHVKISPQVASGMFLSMDVSSTNGSLLDIRALLDGDITNPHGTVTTSCSENDFSQLSSVFLLLGRPALDAGVGRWQLVTHF